MEKWLKLFSSESEHGNFEYVHYYCDRVVRLLKVREDGSIVSEFEMDYNEFIELCDFIDKLRS